MKNLLLLSLFAFNLFGCKKEEVKQPPLPKYAVSFTISSTKYPFAIAFNKAGGTTQAAFIDAPGLTFFYGSIERNTELTVIYAKGKAEETSTTIDWRIDNISFSTQTITTDSFVRHHTFRWKIPE